MLFFLLMAWTDWELVLVDGRVETLAGPIEMHASQIWFRNEAGQYFVIAADLVRETRPRVIKPLPVQVSKQSEPVFPTPQQGPEKPILVTDKILEHFGQTHRWEAPETQYEQPVDAGPDGEAQEANAQDLLQEQRDRNEALAKKSKPLIARIKKSRAKQASIRKDLRFEQDETKRRALHKKLKELQAQINRDKAQLVEIQEEGRRNGAKVRHQIDP